MSTTTIPPVLTLTCLDCGSAARVVRADYPNIQIEQWWAGRGGRCKTCFVPASDELGPASLQDRFERFHSDNPQVYEALIHEGRELLARGHRKFNISLIYERVRWHVYMRTFDDQLDYKLPNNHRAYYARLIMRQEPDFEGVFNTAELRSLR